MHLNQTTLSSDQVVDLSKFQEFLSSFVFDNFNEIFEHDSKRANMIAPLKVGTSIEIDWTLIKQILKVENNRDSIFKPPCDQTRLKMEFGPTNYVNKLLVPWYKKEKEVYCTLSVTNLNARSAFENDSNSKSKYKTFEHYFEEKYDVKIFHPEFPLIHYKAIGNNLNFLTNKFDIYEVRKEIRSQSLKIIPELVNQHVLPASLYVQGKFLPSILHRIYRLLVANDLRVKVAKHFSWDVDSGNFEDMDVDWLQISDKNGSNFEAAKIPQINTTQNTIETEINQNEETNIVLLETVNPNNIDWEIVNKLGRTPIRTTQYALPDPPAYKSNVCDDLVDIKSVKSYHFDKETDFTLEKGPYMQTIMEALTLSNAQDNVSLEKLEVMGDSVLKLIASLHLFHSFPNWDEGKMTQLRTKLISNLHLYQIGKKNELGEILSGSIFIPNKSWLPSGFTIPQNLIYGMNLDNDQSELVKLKNDPHTTYTHSRVGDKSVADCVEALIGAYFRNGGLDGAFRIMDYLGMRGPLENGSAEKYSRKTAMPVLQSNLNSNVPISFLEDLEEILQYEFKDKRIVIEALTHPTFMGNKETKCYQRLEFVGDAILGKKYFLNNILAFNL